jgi:hypothetical protein
MLEQVLYFLRFSIYNVKIVGAPTIYASVQS